MNADQAAKRTNDLLFTLLAEFMEWHTGVSPAAEEVENNIVLRKSAPLSAEKMKKLEAEAKKAADEAKKAEEKAAKDAKDEADKKVAEAAKADAEKAKASKKAESKPTSPKKEYW